MAVGPAVAATSFKASAAAAAATAAPYLTAASSGLQALGAINNARFQADLTKKQNEQLRADTAFKASEAEISIETEKLKLAREEVLRLRKFNQIDGDNVAGSFARGVAIEQDAAQITGLRNLVAHVYRFVHMGPLRARAPSDPSCVQICTHGPLPNGTRRHVRAQ